MEEPHKYESERESCTRLKAQIVSCMTVQVKIKIGSYGYTPFQIATAYILKKLADQDNDNHLNKILTFNLIGKHTVPNYKSMVYNKYRTKIIDIIF